jgi:hypothetical protein
MRTVLNRLSVLCCSSIVVGYREVPEVPSFIGFGVASLFFVFSLRKKGAEREYSAAVIIS